MKNENKHYFSALLAEVVGVNAALIFNHILFWVRKNEENNKNFIDGYFWTYMTISNISEVFPYMTEHKIRSALKKLKDEELIKAEVGINPKNKWDKTSYYRILENPLLDSMKNEPSILKNATHHNNVSDSEKKMEETDAFQFLIDELLARCSLKSKVKDTKLARQTYFALENRESLVEDYLEHQNSEGKFAKTLENFLLDYASYIKDEEVQLWG